MKNLKSIISKIFLIVLSFVFAKSCVSDYVNGGDETKISQLTEMIQNDTHVVAELSNEYTETTVARVVKLYKFDYSFVLDEKSYSGKISLNALPNSSSIKLYYWAGNPEIVSVDPQKDLENENEKGTSITDLLVGIVWGLLSILLLISLVLGFRKKAIAQEQIA